MTIEESVTSPGISVNIGLLIGIVISTIGVSILYRVNKNREEFVYISPGWIHFSDFFNVDRKTFYRTFLNVVYTTPLIFLMLLTLIQADLRMPEVLDNLWVFTIMGFITTFCAEIQSIYLERNTYVDIITFGFVIPFYLIMISMPDTLVRSLFGWTGFIPSQEYFTGTLMGTPEGYFSIILAIGVLVFASVINMIIYMNTGDY